MKRSLLALLLSFVTAGLVISQGTTTSIIATGNSSGHIGNMVIQNLGDNPVNMTIPAAAIPSNGQAQGYIVPNPTPVTVPGKTTTTVPIQGYCTDVNLPAPRPGAALPPLDAWNPNSPLLNPISDIIRATTNLQGSGAITTPFSGDPAQELVAIVQQIFWLTTSTPNQPYTAADLCDRIRRQFQNGTGTPATGLPPDLNHGIAQILDAVTKVGRAAGISTFMPPALPPAASQLIDAPPSSQPLVTNTIRATGTGRTTGHIADITLKNPTDQPVKVQFGPSPKDANALFIPSDGKYQPYIVPYLPAVTIAPGGTADIPVQGFCTDIRLPPVPDGVEMPPISSWVSSAPPVVPEPVNSPDGTEPATLVVPTRSGLPLDQAVSILEALPTIPALSGVDCPEGLLAPAPTIPGSDRPITTPVDPDQHPGLATPLLLDAINRISEAYDELRPKGAISTPFSGNPEKEREAVIQQTFWRYNAALRGEPYEKKDFQDNTVRQFEQNSGKKYADIPKPQQEKMDLGVDDFWNTFEAVGAEAKILPKAPPLPVPSPGVDDFFNTFTPGGIKPKGTTTAPTPSTPQPSPVPPNENEQPELIKDEKVDKQCDCGDISFAITVFRMIPEPDPNNPRGTIYRSGMTSPQDVKESGQPGMADAVIKVGIQGFEKGNRARITLEAITIDCPCIGITDAIKDAVKALEKLERDNAGKLKTARENVAKKEAALEAAKAALEKAKAALEAAKAKAVEKEKKALDNANAALVAAEQALADAQKKDKPSKATIERLEKAVGTAKTKVGEAEEKLQAKEAKLAKDDAFKKEEENIEKAQNAVNDAQTAVDEANGKLSELEKPINDKKAEIEKLKSAAKASDCASDRASIQVSEGSGKKKDAPGVWDGNKFTFQDMEKTDANKKVEHTFHLSFNCKGTDCKPVQCSRTFVVKVEE